jgi:hypothetical protein
MIRVSTQKELEAALKKTEGGRKERVIIENTKGWLRLPPNSSVVARENSSVVAWGNSSVEAWGNSSVVARENSSVVAWENSSVVAWGNSSVVARENSSVVARENSCTRALSPWSTTKASKYAVVIQHDPAAKISGGQIIQAHRPTDGRDWCEFYGVEIRKGGNLSRKLAGQDVAILFKATGPDFATRNGVAYVPGTAPEAPDWDGGKEECGGGLHFSPHPRLAREFREDAEHFVACPVLVSDICVHPEASMPEKTKAPRLCAPCWEVDLKGERIDG